VYLAPSASANCTANRDELEWGWCAINGYLFSHGILGVSDVFIHAHLLLRKALVKDYLTISCQWTFIPEHPHISKIIPPLDRYREYLILHQVRGRLFLLLAQIQPRIPTFNKEDPNKSLLYLPNEIGLTDRENRGFSKLLKVVFGGYVEGYQGLEYSCLSNR
jgi:hypothetical protein